MVLIRDGEDHGMAAWHVRQLVPKLERELDLWAANCTGLSTLRPSLPDAVRNSPAGPMNHMRRRDVSKSQTYRWCIDRLGFSPQHRAHLPTRFVLSP